MDEDWNKNKLIGNGAENIVEFLINSMPDWKCIRFGVENHIEDIRNRIKNITNPITTKIRKMPDFLAFNEKTEETFFVEVKFRSDSKKEEFFFKYLENYNEYWEGTKLIIVRVNEPYFVCVDLKEIEFSMRKMIKFEDKSVGSWNFNGIEKGIKDLFPDLKDENIEEAIKRIAK